MQVQSRFDLSKLGLIVKIFVLVIILIAFLPLFLPFTTINYGEVGVITRFGKIERILNPGLNFKIPLVESVESFRTQKIIYETSEHINISNADYKDEPVDSSTQDGQQISIRYTVRFRLPPENIKKIAETLGYEQQVVERVIKTESRSVVRNVSRQFTAQEMYTGDIFKFQAKVTELLKASFNRNGISLDEFLVRQVIFGNDYISAVEQKQIEKEKVKTEEYKAEQEKFKKEQQITRAEGEARAQEVLRGSISELLLQKLAIDKWNGILPTYVGAGNAPLPFISVK